MIEAGRVLATDRPDPNKKSRQPASQDLLLYLFSKTRTNNTKVLCNLASLQHCCHKKTCCRSVVTLDVG